MKKQNVTMSVIPDERIVKRIYWIRGEKVMIDSDLAELYGVETKQLKRAVRRNIERFPEDFMFLLNAKEMEILKYQFGTSSWVDLDMHLTPSLSRVWLCYLVF